MTAGGGLPAPVVAGHVPPPTVLVVDDEEAFVDALTVGLTREGFTVEVARDGLAAIEAFDSLKPNLVLLDVMLPRLSGIDVCRHIRTCSTTPVIMVTARSEEIDAVVGLEIGADDYVTKPYRLRELVARMRAVLRRAAAPAEVGAGDGAGSLVDDEDILAVGDVHMDLGRHEVRLRGDEVPLALKEFELLELFLANAGRVLTRGLLIDRVWGSDYVGDGKTLDVHVKRLRAKIEDDPARPGRITTIRGLGYRYERSGAPPTPAANAVAVAGAGAANPTGAAGSAIHGGPE